MLTLLHIAYRVEAAAEAYRSIKEHANQEAWKARFSAESVSTFVSRVFIDLISILDQNNFGLQPSQGPAPSEATAEIAPDPRGTRNRAGQKRRSLEDYARPPGAHQAQVLRPPGCVPGARAVPRFRKGLLVGGSW